MDRSEAVAFLWDKDRLAYCDMIDILLSEEEAEIAFLSEDGMLIRHPCSTFMAASFTADHSWIDPFIPSMRLVAAHGTGLSEHIARAGFREGEPCYLFVYEGDRIGEDHPAIRPLGPEHAEMAAEAYGHEAGYINERIGKGRLWGIFPDGELAGFAGFHSEGAMGMLEILPRHRRMGYGRLLESFLIDRALAEGRRAYCNVYRSNEASISLQRHLGLAASGMLTSWLWKDA